MNDTKTNQAVKTLLLLILNYCSIELMWLKKKKKDWVIQVLINLKL